MLWVSYSPQVEFFYKHHGFKFVWKQVQLFSHMDIIHIQLSNILVYFYNLPFYHECTCIPFFIYEKWYEGTDDVNTYYMRLALFYLRALVFYIIIAKFYYVYIA
jgi:hypothetical protein